MNKTNIKTIVEKFEDSNDLENYLESLFKDGNATRDIITLFPEDIKNEKEISVSLFTDDHGFAHIYYHYGKYIFKIYNVLTDSKELIEKTKVVYEKSN